MTIAKKKLKNNILATAKARNLKGTSAIDIMRAHCTTHLQEGKTNLRGRFSYREKISDDQVIGIVVFEDIVEKIFDADG